MLARLIQANRSEQLRSAENRGFVDARSGRFHRLCGTYTFLHEKCVAFPKLTRKEFRVRRRIKKRPPSAGGRKASSKRTGEYFHRQAHHALICLTSPKKECQCPDLKSKKAKVAVVRKTSAAFEMVQAVKRFVAENNLVPLSGEQVIAAPSVGLGTRYDMICERLLRPGRLVLVSWKTTGACPFGEGISQVSVEDRVCRRVTEQTSSEAIASREHLAQLVLELHMLRDEHRVTEVKEAVIVYLTPFQNTYRVISLDADSIEGGGYKRAWQWIMERRA